MDMSILAFVLVLVLAFANGANDVSKAIATLVGSGVTGYRAAILWGTVWTVIGAGLSGLIATAMVKIFSQGLLAPGISTSPTLAAAVLTGAVLWVLVATWTGLPVSTTHALTGAIVGVGLVAFGAQGLVWTGIGKKIVLPLVLSPVLALTVSVLVHHLVRTVAAKWQGTCLCVMPTARALVVIDAHGATRMLFQATGLGQPVVAVPAQCDRAGLNGLTVGLDSIHWCSSGLASLARGTNDAPKIAAILLLGSAVASWPSAVAQNAAFIGVALAMGLGSYLAGLRVTQVLAENVTRMDHSKEPRPSRRGFCKPRGNVPPLRYGLPFLPALPSGASWQILVKDCPRISRHPLWCSSRRSWGCLSQRRTSAVRRSSALGC